MGMGRAEQTGRGTGAASGQEVGGRSAGMPPVVICGWAGGPEGRMGLPKLYIRFAAILHLKMTCGGLSAIIVDGVGWHAHVFVGMLDDGHEGSRHPTRGHGRDRQN